MAKPGRLLLLLLALAACVFSVSLARQSGTYAYYIGASFALIGIGALGIPASSDLAADNFAVRAWWGPAVLSVGLMVLVGVLAGRFLALAA